MNKSRILWLGFACFILSLLNCSSVNTEANASDPFSNPFQQRFSAVQLRADADSLFAILERIHPNLYANIPRDSLKCLRANLKLRLTDSLTSLDFWKQAGPLVTKLKDGHTALYFPYEYRRFYLVHGGKIFPFEIRIDGNQAFIANSYSADSTIHINAEILSINHIPVVEILKTMRHYQSGEQTSFINIGVARYFKVWLWALFGLEDQFVLQLKNQPGGTVYRRTVSGVTREQFESRRKKPKSSAPYLFREIENTKIGLIDFRRMVDRRRFKQFLKTTFRRIREDGVSDLIIDIRQNGGGNSRLADELFKYIADTSYVQATKMVLKISRESRAQFKKKFLKWYMYPLYPLAYFHPMARHTLFGKIGTTVEMEFTPEKPDRADLFFGGPVYLLTGTRTFSSATILADVFKCYRMGTVIGEETGGLTVAFGEVTFFRLPNTHLRGGCSSKQFFHPCGKPDGHGVIPNIEVKQNPGDSAKGIDTVLDFTVRYIRNR